VTLQQLPKKDVQKEACGALNQLAANADNQVAMAKQLRSIKKLVSNAMTADNATDSTKKCGQELLSKLG